MIAVIADDLTGAAELGGIGLNFNLKVEVALDVDPLSEADLLIISTDTRSGSQDEAVRCMETVTTQIAAMQPQLIFKKVDSVLRGHIVPEIKGQLDVLGLNRALLVPANPALGRTIEDGRYLIYGKPIDETGFSDDPEFPVKSSAVKEILSSADLEVSVVKVSDDFPQEGVFVGEAATAEDLKQWASRKERVFLAGGAGFFSALLSAHLPETGKKTVTDNAFQGKKLYVCGTAFSSSALRISALSNQEGLVNYLPENIFMQEGLSRGEILNYCLQVTTQIENNDNAIVAINPDIREGKAITALELRERTASVVKGIFERVEVDELIIEGGSTASAILRALKITRLFPENEYAPGVIRCGTGEFSKLHITLKPGSYNWPREVWAF